MATSKQSFARATEPQCSASAQREEETHIQASLTTMYVHSVPAPGLQPYPQAQPGALQDATVVPLFLPRMCSSSALPSLTLHIPSSTALQQQRLVAPATSARPKSVGKHICPHCGKDCLKPSVLEKHLRCHTGERPYPCTTCGISFKTQSNLYKHKRTQAHARLSSESDKGTFSSQESMESSKDNCTSPSPEVNGGDSADIQRNKEVLSMMPASTPAQVHSSEPKTMSGIEWALHNAAMVGISTTPALQDKVNSLRKPTVELSLDVENNVSIHPTIELSEDECTRVTSNRTPLQRQEALFSKPSFPFHSKPQSHDSTDSGFSDSSEHHSSSSPGASLHDPNMESLTETMERQEPGDLEMTTEDSKSKVSIQEKQKLEEHISKLIYENSVLMNNKQLENVRPRKTILSKQGSIDLPVPYTYKDSFHFEIRNSKHISQNQDRGGGAIHIALPTQNSTSLVHAPLTRSSSLPFTMGGKPPDGAMNLNLSRRCSAGHVYPLRSPDQQATGHRSLVRQVAVDGLPSAEGSMVERGSMRSLSSEGDSTDVGTEPYTKGNYRKKARKFDYTKWHTYKGGTFRKLYNSEKDSPLKMKKTASISEPSESLEIHTSQQRDNGSVNMSFSSGSVVTLQNDHKVSHTSLDNNHVKVADIKRDELVTQHTDCHIPSERKKQRTGNDVQPLSVTDPRTGDGCALMGQPLPPACATQKSCTQNLHPQGSFIHPFSNPSLFLGNTRNSAICLVSISGTSATPSASITSPTVPEAKTSFPPMYQLKIPCSTDGVSASCSGSTLTHSTCSTVPALRKSHQTAVEFHLENGVLSSKQSHSASIDTTIDRNTQEALCVTTSMPMLSVSCSGLNQTNTLSKVPTQLPSTTPTSVSLVSSMLPSPVQHQVSLLQSNCATGVVEKLSTDPVSSVCYHPLNVLTTSENTQPVTSENTTSTVSNCAEFGQQTHSPGFTTPRVQNHPPFPVNESGHQRSDTKPEVYENTLNRTAPKLHTGDFEGSQSEGNVILLNGSAQAQNMFYVRTADLQIVMQLISDEQLALIEPHIETTTSVTLTKQTSLSQEVCQSDVAQEMKNNDETSKKNASESCESECLANKAKPVCSLSSQTDQNDQDTIPQCVSPWSHPQTQFHVSATVDSKSSTSRLYETQKILDISQERNFEVTTDSHHKLVAGEKLTEPHLLDKSFSRREIDKETEDCPVYITDTDRSTEDQINAEITRDPSHLMESNHIQPVKNPEAGELNETSLMSAALSGNGESVHTKATEQLRMCICEKKASTAESQQMYKVLNSTTQTKPYLETREMRACETLSSNHETLVTETFCPGQTSTRSELQEAFALETGDLGSDARSPAKASYTISNRTPNVQRVIEDSNKCGNVHAHHVSLEILTEPEEDGDLGSSTIQESPGTERKKTIVQQDVDGGTEVKEQSTDAADTNNTSQICKDDGKQDKRKEEATSCAEHQTCAQPMHFSGGESFNTSEPLQHEKFNPDTSVFLSQSCQSQQTCNNKAKKDSMGEYLDNTPSQETSQQQTTSKSVTKYSNQTHRCPALENPTQSEFQKDTQTRAATSYWIYSKSSQTLTSQHKMSGTTVSDGLLQHNCGVFRTEALSGSITPSSSNGSHQTTIHESHTHQISPPGNSTEPKHIYLGNNSYLEHEDSNSSSDDEQKLVIELE